MIGALGWLLISFAMSGPKVITGSTKDNIKANDIFFVIDVSHSMLADDFLPNRLEVAKNKIKDFVKLRPTDRIGIIMFSEKVFTLLPLTMDLNLINRIIDEVNVGFLGSGTNIGDALGLAVARGAQSLSKKKVIILLTDGVSNVGSLTPSEAARKSKKLGIKIYSIGIGGRNSAKIPVSGSSHRKQNIPGGSSDFKVLEDISKITNGRTYVANNAGALKKIFLEIDKLEKKDIKVNRKILYRELFYKYLFVGTFLIFMSTLMKLFILREFL